MHAPLKIKILNLKITQLKRKVIFHPPPWPWVQNLNFRGCMSRVSLSKPIMSRIWPLHRQSITKPRNMRCSASTGKRVSRGNGELNQGVEPKVMKVWFRWYSWIPMFFHHFLVPSIHFPGCIFSPMIKRENKVFKTLKPLDGFWRLQKPFRFWTVFFSACRGCSFWKTLRLVWSGRLRFLHVDAMRAWHDSWLRVGYSTEN